MPPQYTHWVVGVALAGDTEETPRVGPPIETHPLSHGCGKAEQEWGNARRDYKAGSGRRNPQFPCAACPPSVGGVAAGPSAPPPPRVRREPRDPHRGSWLPPPTVFDLCVCVCVLRV